MEPAEGEDGQRRESANSLTSLHESSKERRDITKELFVQWTSRCRARRIQRRIKDIIVEAEGLSTPPEQHLHNLGYKDFAALQKVCPEFSLWCNTSTFGELGVGFVLYFRELKFLVLVLLIIGLLQIPALLVYGKTNHLYRWEHHDDWRRGWTLDTSAACDCLGTNNGLHGPRGVSLDPKYGTTCGTWDLDACLAGAFPNPGQWCCRSWCFADTVCVEAVEAASPSMSQRLYNKMARATAKCQQNETLLRERCAGLPDVAFNEDVAAGLKALESRDTIAQNFVSKWWLTPGNLGPDEADETQILAVGVVSVLFLSLCIIAHRQYQNRTVQEVDDLSVMPNDFAVMVQGLPPTVTDESAIADFFRKNAVAVEGNESIELVKVVIGWDASCYRKRMLEISRTRSILMKQRSGVPQATGCCWSTPEAKQEETVLTERIMSLKKSIYEAAPDATEKLTSSGTAVVVFRWQQDMRDCLEKWSGFWQRWAYCEPAAGGLMPGKALPTFGETNAKLQVIRAANPGDINWEELGGTSLQRNLLWVGSTLAMLVLIAIGFTVSYFLNQWQISLLTGDKSYSQRALSILPATVITLINFLLRVAGRIFGEWEYQDTWGQQEFSQGYKMTFSMIANTAFVIVFINFVPKEWFRRGGLVDDIFYMFVIDSIVARLCLFSDITYALNYYYRRHLTDERIKDLNKTLAQNASRSTPAQEEVIEGMVAEIESYKQAFEPEEIDNPDRYARIVQTFLCAIFFTPVFPASCLIGALGLLLQYGLDKFLLVKWWKRPRPQNEMQAMWSLQMLKVLAPLALSAGCWVFLSPMWEEKRQVLSFFVAGLFICLVMAVFPSRLLAWLNFFGFVSSTWRRYCSKKRSLGDATCARFEDYYNAQHMWPKEMVYHMDQPVYRQLYKARKLPYPHILQPDQSNSSSLAEVKANYEAAVKNAGGAGGRFGRAGRAASHQRLEAMLGNNELIWGNEPTEEDPRKEVVTPTNEAPASSESQAVSWHYGNRAGDGYRPYASGCQAYIEAKYQAFLKDPSVSKVTVKDEGATIYIDFAKMKQKVKGGTRERVVHRGMEL